MVNMGQIKVHHMAEASILWLVLASLCNVITSVDVTVRITYRDPLTGEMIREADQMARYGVSSERSAQWGWLVHVDTLDGGNHACTPPVNYPSYPWVALIQRGECKFEQKIHNAAAAGNASAVLIYNNMGGSSVVHMTHDNPGVVAAFIGQTKGESLARLVDSGICVLIEMAPSEDALPDVNYHMVGGCAATTTTMLPTTPRDKSVVMPIKDGTQDEDDLEQRGEDDPQSDGQQSGAAVPSQMSRSLFISAVMCGYIITVGCF